MKIYFDESYPENKSIVILGALFLSDKSHTYLHKEILRIKKLYGLKGELKYSNLTTNKKYKAAIEISRLFFKAPYPFMRICIVPFSAQQLKRTKGTSANISRVKVYVDSAIKLITVNLPPVHNTEIYMDEEATIEKTNLYTHLTKIHIPNGAKIISVTPINSKDQTKSSIQLCDLLIGSVYQNLFPSKSKKSRYKREFSKHVLKKLKAPTFSKSYWSKIVKKAHPKFTVSYWKTPNIIKQTPKKQKNRS